MYAMGRNDSGSNLVGNAAGMPVSTPGPMNYPPATSPYSPSPSPQNGPGVYASVIVITITTMAERVNQIARQLNYPNGLLAGQVAIITGAGQGIGAECARLFANEGARVIVADIDGPKAEDVAARICATGGDALAVQGDLLKDECITDLVAKAAEFGNGKIHILVNNAGFTWDAVIHKTIAKEWGPAFGVRANTVAFGHIDTRLTGAKAETKKKAEAGAKGTEGGGEGGKGMDLKQKLDLKQVLQGGPEMETQQHPQDTFQTGTQRPSQDTLKTETQPLPQDISKMESDQSSPDSLELPQYPWMSRAEQLAYNLVKIEAHIEHLTEDIARLEAEQAKLPPQHTPKTENHNLTQDVSKMEAHRVSQDASEMEGQPLPTNTLKTDTPAVTPEYLGD
ncbi:hypothetical protein N0V88_003227 [Collariella sp. IMI 366227]|nr:hypothetical protein N0V88_003227 [Collariella sp. IMI 366227]